MGYNSVAALSAVGAFSSAALVIWRLSAFCQIRSPCCVRWAGSVAAAHVSLCSPRGARARWPFPTVPSVLPFSCPPPLLLCTCCLALCSSRAHPLRWTFACAPIGCWRVTPWGVGSLVAWALQFRALGLSCWALPCRQACLWGAFSSFRLVVGRASVASVWVALPRSVTLRVGTPFTAAVNTCVVQTGLLAPFPVPLDLFPPLPRPRALFVCAPPLCLRVCMKAPPSALPSPLLQEPEQLLPGSRST